MPNSEVHRVMRRSGHWLRRSGVVYTVLAAMLLIASPAHPAFSAAGVVDATFGTNGLVFTEIPRPAGFESFYPLPESIVVQPDGRILVSGRFWEDFVSYWYGTFIARYMPDGTLDSSFGTDGIVARLGGPYPVGSPGTGADMALQPDGKIILIGQVAIAQSILVQRYTSSGQVDTTFAQGGTAFVEGTRFSEGTSVAVQPDGKIVGVGWDYEPFATPYYDAILLFRLTAEGSPDTSFGAEGTGKLFIQNGYDGARVLLQTDAKILVVGTLWNPHTFPVSAVLMARYNSDGSLDSSFGTGGRVIHQIDTQLYASAAVLQTDGKIVVADARKGLIRFNSDGGLDENFGTDGVAAYNLADFRYPAAVVIQPDGKITVTGNVPNATTGRSDVAVLRFRSDGSPDETFGGGGRASYSINAGGTNYAYAAAVAMQRDGKMLVAGGFGYYYSDSHEKIALVRILTDTASQFEPLPEDPSRLPRLIRQVTTGGSTGESLSYALVIPAAGTVQGSGGTVFRTDVTLSNGRSNDQDLIVAWLPQGNDRGPAVPMFRATLPGAEEGGTLTIRDLADQLGVTGLGSIVIIAIDPVGEPDATAVIHAFARVYSPSRCGGGTVSQSLPAVPLNASGSTRRGRALGLRHEPAYRTNVGIVNLGEVTREFTIIVNGDRASERFSVSVPPFSPLQALVPDRNYGAVAVTVISDGAASPWTAYGSSVDNASGDAWAALANPLRD
jgi:uncharacterized delta-60 repeat protein